jgi:DNA-binding response OmpR family regulator
VARVLVVDDERDLAEVACLVLEWAGHDATVWHPGERVIDAVRRHRPDVIVLDWVLGDSSGDRVLEELRADLSLAATPVVVMSALHGLESLARLLGARGFVKKPFEPDDLVRAVDAVLLPEETTHPAP